MAPPAEAITKSAPKAVNATPEARPSRPSIRFTALITATIQATVSGTDQAPSTSEPQGPSRRSSDRPKATATRAIPTWATSLTRARMPRRSSMIPTPAINAVPSRIAGRSPLRMVSEGSTRVATSSAATTPRKRAPPIATPPSLGMATSCTFRSSGSSSRPRWVAAPRMRGVRMAEATRAATKATAGVSIGRRRSYGRVMVGAARFERATSCSQSRCATRLRYAPTGASHAAG